ncbi:hypothetical protein AC579_6979 [Pseudocercospora musae]|uniref:Glutaminase A n=1 Tax=Pseudocercospora musae TaxID=113226 RepID=A0A139IAH1_9PEZI|nr:hypothetical protein AC579_6979 [Pseudocercospora musae]
MNSRSRQSPSTSKVILTICAFWAISLLCFQWATRDIPDVSSVAAWDRDVWSLPSITMGFFGYLRFLCASIVVFLPKQTVTLSIAGLPSYPLAVKSPYLSAWLPSDQIADIANGQPEFWTGTSNLNWSVLARVDGTTYALLNAPSGLTSDILHATTKGVSYTSTHTYFELLAGHVTFILDFFSPVYPACEDYALQSLPYSYLTVKAISGHSSKSIEIFSAIDQSWTAQNGAAALNFTTSSNAGFFWFYNADQIPYTEVSDMATWGSILFGASKSNDTTFGCDSASNVYSTFANHGALDSADSSKCLGGDLAGVAIDLGTTGSATFFVGCQRDLAIQYLGEAQTGFHRTQWPTVPEAIDAFLLNYDAAQSYSLALDMLIRSKAESVSGEFGAQYADILEASVRQSFAAYELTVPSADRSAEPSLFLKEISSDGNVNTVDLIFQSWPIFVNLNPEYIKLVFKPILSYLASGRWPLDYVIHDIGTHYPNATGHDDGNEEHMPLFETSSMFILLYAYQKLSGNTSFTEEHSTLLPGWADYLVANSLYPASQLISVDAIAATANQTGLAIQSAIGLKAAAILTGNDTYADIADEYAKTIYNEALGLNSASVDTSTHFTYNYGDTDTWNVLFPAYSDVFLNLSTFPQEAWHTQSAFYLTQIQEYGLAFAGPENDRGVNWALTDWNIMYASIAGSELQQAIINTTHAFLTDGQNDIPFGTKYVVSGAEAGKWIGNRARSTVGTHFALTALKQGRWTLP